MRTFAEAERQFTSAEAGGFDLSQPQVALLLNEGVERLASGSKWIKALVPIGPTVAGQPIYQLPDKVVQLEQLYVGESPWTEVDMLTLREVTLGRRQLVSNWGDGIYAEEADESGQIKILRLFPTPEADDVALQGWASVVPDPLAGEDVLPFPPEFNRAVVDYAKAVAYADIDENKKASEEYFESANARAEQLGERARAKMRRNPRRIHLTSLRA